MSDLSKRWEDTGDSAIRIGNDRVFRELKEAIRRLQQELVAVEARREELRKGEDYAI
jgi:hypothetical protein